MLNVSAGRDDNLLSIETISTDATAPDLRATGFLHEDVSSRSTAPAQRAWLPPPAAACNRGRVHRPHTGGRTHVHSFDFNRIDVEGARSSSDATLDVRGGSLRLRTDTCAGDRVPCYMLRTSGRRRYRPRGCTASSGFRRARTQACSARRSVISSPDVPTSPALSTQARSQRLAGTSARTAHEAAYASAPQAGEDRAFCEARVARATKVRRVFAQVHSAASRFLPSPLLATMPRFCLSLMAAFQSVSPRTSSFFKKFVAWGNDPLGRAVCSREARPEISPLMARPTTSRIEHTCTTHAGIMDRLNPVVPAVSTAKTSRARRKVARRLTGMLLTRRPRSSAWTRGLARAKRRRPGCGDRPATRWTASPEALAALERRDGVPGTGRAA